MYQLRSLKKLGRSVGRANRSAIARQVVRDERIRTRVIELLGTHMGKEMKKLCTKEVMSVLRKADSDSVQQFSVKSIIEEMKTHAPSVLTVLRGCVHGRRRSRAKKQKSRMIDVDTVVGVCCAILLRGRSQKMNLLQRIISLILFCGHASKRVSNTVNNKFYIFIFLTCTPTVRCILGCKSCVYVCHTRRQQHVWTDLERTLMQQCCSGKRT